MTPPNPGACPAFATEPTWRAISGMSRTRTYIELAAGNLRAKKLGKRLLIDVPHGLAFLAALPDAKFKTSSPTDQHLAPATDAGSQEMPGHNGGPPLEANVGHASRSRSTGRRQRNEVIAADQHP
jgi:hypothetical protein